MELEERVRQLDRGVRAIGVVVLLFAGLFSVRTAMQADEMENIFREMLGDKPLPLVSLITFQFQGEILAVALLAPLAGITAAFVGKSPRCALYTVAAAVLVSLSVGLFMFSGYYAPMKAIIMEMNAQ
ncbi:MAG: hypothetical protein P1U87_04015 [Verrucomicrobiales bacterium]|nr:hypothetical protein [Verrucomicrobiales bacterium]